MYYNILVKLTIELLHDDKKYTIQYGDSKMDNSLFQLCVIFLNSKKFFHSTWKSD